MKRLLKLSLVFFSFLILYSCTKKVEDNKPESVLTPAGSFDCLIGIFTYNDSIQNYSLTNADISVFADSETPLLTTSSSEFSGKWSSVYDSVKVTTKLTLPERFNNFTIIVSKPDYETYTQTFTREELKLHYRSTDKGPLVVILPKSSLLDGLVAYYKCNGSLLDYSGNSNHGTDFGRGVYSEDRKSVLKGALEFNGTSDYAKVTNSEIINPQSAITLSAWIKPPVIYVGSGNDPLIEKPNTTHTSPYYQYRLGISGNYGTAPYNFAMNLAINGKYTGVGTKIGGAWTPNNWYLLVGSFDGKMMRFYVNGIRVDSLQFEGTLGKYNTDLFIGKMGNRSVFTPVIIDEIRIYNRALKPEEIRKLYKQ